VPSPQQGFQPGGELHNQCAQRVASVKRYCDTEPVRIGMWEHSVGGYISPRSMAIVRDISAGVIRAVVVALYPVLFTRWNPGGVFTAPSPRSFVYSLEQEFGSAEENPRFWYSISAISYLQD